jgi:hypothetical protein
MRQLNIRMIAAYSPQARGRSERQEQEKFEAWLQ